MCRGQAYDGASTISGRFSGLQSRVKELNPLAMYIHCCAHNLNLVLIDSIRSSVVAISFFGTLETLYKFLTVSLPRLHILKKEQAKEVEGVILTLKKLSDTRWAKNIKSMRTNEHFLEIQKNAIKLCETFDGATKFEDFSNTVQKFECLDPKKYFFKKKVNEKSINQLKKLSDIYQIDIDQDDLILEYESFSSVYYHLNKDCEDISTNELILILQQRIFPLAQIQKFQLS
ncbi:uncharacterized protein LOC112596191 [Melanaphis sacchari]|uniref:uncharacterized protein LOC112596191 n=1 Tax=Melanaphis sacchari TaxID=742174 RepID=UPI000DC14F8A|nr:uncharacterized protein LOC112596191 [Melanaphis sacchari]